MLIQVDVDSTLYDADKLFGQIATGHGIEWPYGANSWLPPEKVKFHTGEPCSLGDLKRVFKEAHSKEVVAKNKPYPNAVKTLIGIVEDYPEAEIAYVSDRNEQQTTALSNWLEQEGFLTSEDQHVIATKDKREWMRENRPAIVIDDRVRTMLMARFELEAQVVSLEHKWNVNLTGEAVGIYIVKNWKEIDTVLREAVIPKLQTLVRV